MNMERDDSVDGTDAGRGEFERRVSALLAQSADSLDGRTRSALTRARYAALEQMNRRTALPRGPLRRGWVPAGALAMALLVVVFYVGQHPGSNPLAVPVAASGNGADDLALVSDADTFELSVDSDADLDSDFYEWAAAGGATGNGQSS